MTETTPLTPDQVRQALADLPQRSQRERARLAARSPKKIGNVMARLMSSRGYGRVQSAGDMSAAWRQAAGETFAQQTRLGKLNRGVLEVMVSNAVLVQELGFARREILARLQQLVPDANITNLRFRTGPIK